MSLLSRFRPTPPKENETRFHRALDAALRRAYARTRRKQSLRVATLLGALLLLALVFLPPSFHFAVLTTFALFLLLDVAATFRPIRDLDRRRLQSAARLERRFPEAQGLFVAALEFDENAQDAQSKSDDSEELRKATARAANELFERKFQALDVQTRDRALLGRPDDPGSLAKQAKLQNVFALVLAIELAASGALLFFRNDGVSNKAPIVDSPAGATQISPSAENENTTSLDNDDDEIAFEKTNDDETVDETNALNLLKLLRDDLARLANLTQELAQNVLSNDPTLEFQLARELQTNVDAPSSGAAARTTQARRQADAFLQANAPGADDGQAFLAAFVSTRLLALERFWKEDAVRQKETIEALGRAARTTSEKERDDAKELVLLNARTLAERLQEETNALDATILCWNETTEGAATRRLERELFEQAVVLLAERPGADALQFGERDRKTSGFLTTLNAYEQSLDKLQARARQFTQTPQSKKLDPLIVFFTENCEKRGTKLTIMASNGAIDELVLGRRLRADQVREDARFERWGKVATALSERQPVPTEPETGEPEMGRPANFARNGVDNDVVVRKIRERFVAFLLFGAGNDRADEINQTFYQIARKNVPQERSLQAKRDPAQDDAQGTPAGALQLRFDQKKNGNRKDGNAPESGKVVQNGSTNSESLISEPQDALASVEPNANDVALEGIEPGSIPGDAGGGFASGDQGVRERFPTNEAFHTELQLLTRNRLEASKIWKTPKKTAEKNRRFREALIEKNKN